MLLIGWNGKVRLQYCAQILGQDRYMCCQLDNSDKQRPGEKRKNKRLTHLILKMELVSPITIKVYQISLSATEYFSVLE